VSAIFHLTPTLLGTVPLATGALRTADVWLIVGGLAAGLCAMSALRWSRAVGSGHLDTVPRFKRQTLLGAVFVIIPVVRLLTHHY
jgi:hypothetical protein